MKESILELLESKKLDIIDYDDSHELYEALDLHEIIDRNIDISNYDLRKWAVDNYDKVEDAINEGLVDTTNFDFHRAIQAGQYLALREEAQDIVEEIFTNFLDVIIRG